MSERSLAAKAAAFGLSGAALIGCAGESVADKAEQEMRSIYETLEGQDIYSCDVVGATVVAAEDGSRQLEAVIEGQQTEMALNDKYFRSGGESIDGKRFEIMWTLGEFAAKNGQGEKTNVIIRSNGSLANWLDWESTDHQVAAFELEYLEGEHATLVSGEADIHAAFQTYLEGASDYQQTVDRKSVSCGRVSLEGDIDAITATVSSED